MYYEEIDHPDNPDYSRGKWPLPGGEDVFWHPKTEGPDAPTERVKAIAQRRELWEPGVGSVHMTADELLAFGEECASGVVICLCGGFKFKIIMTKRYETTGECLDCGRREVVHSG